MKFEMFARVQMDRDITDSFLEFSPGGYEFIANGKTYCFDFNRDEMLVNESQPDMLEIYGYNPDNESGDTKQIDQNILSSIEYFTDFYIFTGEKKSSPRPVALLECEFCFPESGKIMTVPKSVCEASIVSSLA